MPKQATKPKVLPLPSSGHVRGHKTPVANVRAEPSVPRQTAAARLKAAQLRARTCRTKAGAGQIGPPGIGMPAVRLQGRPHLAGAQQARAGQHAGSRRQPGRQRAILGQLRHGTGKAAKCGAASAEALSVQPPLGTLGSPEPREGVQQADPSVRLQVSPEGKVSLFVSPHTASRPVLIRDASGRFLSHRPGGLACHGSAAAQQHARAAGTAAALLEPCTEEATPGRAALPNRTAPCDEAIACARGRLKRVPGGDPLQVRKPCLPCCVHDTNSVSLMSLLCCSVHKLCTPALPSLLWLRVPDKALR